MTGYLFTKKEDAILKEWYPKEGLPGAIVRLKQAGFIRTSNSVRRRASILKLRSPYCLANFPIGTNPLESQNRSYKKYLETKKLIESGTRVGEACRMTGITRGPYYRFRKMGF